MKQGWIADIKLHCLHVQLLNSNQRNCDICTSYHFQQIEQIFRKKITWKAEEQKFELWKRKKELTDVLKNNDLQRFLITLKLARANLLAMASGKLFRKWNSLLTQAHFWESNNCLLFMEITGGNLRETSIVLARLEMVKARNAPVDLIWHRIGWLWSFLLQCALFPQLHIL